MGCVGVNDGSGVFLDVIADSCLLVVREDVCCALEVPRGVAGCQDDADLRRVT